MSYSDVQSPTRESSQNSPSLPPQKPQRRQLIPWLLGILVLVGGGVLAWQFLLKDSLESAPAQEQAQSISVQLQRVTTGLIQESSEFVGALEAKQRALVRPETEGRITQILVQPGDIVGVGTPIMQLRLDRNRAQVNAAVANVNVQRAAVNNARAELRIAEAQLREAQDARDSSRAEVARQDAEVALEQEEFKRTQFLVDSGAQSQQQLDLQRRNRDTAIAARDSAQKQLNASEAAIRVTQERIEAARATIDEENAALSQVQAQVDVVSEDLNDNKIVAPISGVVTDIPVKVGDYVTIGQEITSLIQNQTLELRLAIPAERSAQLQAGLPVELSLGEEGKPLVTGEISFVSPQVDSENQTILAKASFPNPNGTLRSEQFVRAKVIWNERLGVLIPTTAISYLGNQAFVFVAETESESGQEIARQKPVKLGGIEGNSYQVLEGLEGGERIVTSGILNLSDGAPITSTLVGSNE